MRLTYFGANSWLLELGAQRILIDPWLVGSLVFGNLDWLFKGKRRQPLSKLPENINLILLSQGLEDHAHRPTLQQLDRSIPVVASPNAAKVVQSLGYQQVTALSPGQIDTFADQVEIRALPGAPIGLTIENGYLLKDLHSNVTLYYEPHGFPPAELKALAPVDVVISPLVSLVLPLVGPIIKGDATAPEIVQWVHPQVFLPTAVGGDIEYEGLLDSLIRSKGSGEKLRSRLAQEGYSTRVIEPKPREPFEVPLERSPVSG